MLSNQPFFLPGDQNHACLLLHGLGGGIYEMQLLGQALHQQGLTVQGILYPGHDLPAEKMPNSTWQQWYGHILEAYRSLCLKHRQVSVVGFSTGAILGLHLAATQPLHRLVLLSPFLLICRQWYYLLPPEAYLYSLGQWVTDVPRWRLPIRDPVMHQGALKACFFRTFNLVAVRSAMELINRVKPEVPTLSVPTLIMQSRCDSVVDPTGAQWLYATLGSTTKRLVWLTESDHIISLDKEREQVFSEVGQFLIT